MSLSRRALAWCSWVVLAASWALAAVKATLYWLATTADWNRVVSAVRLPDPAPEEGATENSPRDNLGAFLWRHFAAFFSDGDWCGVAHAVAQPCYRANTLWHSHVTEQTRCGAIELCNVGGLIIQGKPFPCLQGRNLPIPPP